MNIKLTETIVDGLYRYVVEYDGVGVQQDFPMKMDHEEIEKMFMKEIQMHKEKKKNELHLESNKEGEHG
jgi:hypothetical protein